MKETVSKTEFVNSITKGLDKLSSIKTDAQRCYDEETSFHNKLMSESSKTVNQDLKNKALAIKRQCLHHLEETRSQKEYILSTQRLITLIENDKLNDNQLQFLVDCTIIPKN